MICCCCCFNIGGCLECCSGISPKTCQAIKITNSVIKLILLSVSISLIDWEKIPKINIICFCSFNPACINIFHFRSSSILFDKY